MRADKDVASRSPYFYTIISFQSIESRKIFKCTNRNPAYWLPGGEDQYSTNKTKKTCPVGVYTPINETCCRQEFAIIFANCYRVNYVSMSKSNVPRILHIICAAVINSGRPLTELTNGR